MFKKILISTLWILVCITIMYYSLDLLNQPDWFAVFSIFFIMIAVYIFYRWLKWIAKPLLDKALSDMDEHLTDRPKFNDPASNKK